MELSGRQLVSLKSELAETIEINKQQQDSIQSLRWIEDRVPDAQRRFAAMEQKVSYESAAYLESVRAQVKLEDEKKQVVQDLKDAVSETTVLRRKLDETIKTADLHHRDYLAAQREVSDLRDATNRHNSLHDEVGDLQKQVEELQVKLLDAQN